MLMICGLDFSMCSAVLSWLAGVRSSGVSITLLWWMVLCDILLFVRPSV